MSNSKADVQIMKIAKILHGPSCGTTNCADCHYHDIPSIFPVNDKCHDYYSAIELVKQGFVDGADFDAFVKTNTSVSQIQALTELKKDAVELTTDEFGQVEVVEIDAIDNLIRTIEEGNPKDSIVLSREEYEMLKSLYDTQKGAIMTSSIGDLPLTVEGLRKAVDEITRLNRVETELQELNAKYYNEAKDLRRELKQTRKETAEKIISAMKTMIINRRADERSGLNSIYTTYSPERLFDDILDYVRIAMGVEVEQ